MFCQCDLMFSDQKCVGAILKDKTYFVSNGLLLDMNTSIHKKNGYNVQIYLLVLVHAVPWLCVAKYIVLF